LKTTVAEPGIAACSASPSAVEKYGFFAPPHYDRERVEDLAYLRSDVRLVARNGIYHVVLGWKVFG